MDMSTQDYLKKALLDTQEKVRDYMNYADQVKDQKLRSFFREQAEVEGLQARELQCFLDDLHQ